MSRIFALTVTFILGYQFAALFFVLFGSLSWNGYWLLSRLSIFAIGFYAIWKLFTKEYLYASNGKAA